VGVEELLHAKSAKTKLRQDALQKTFSIFWAFVSPQFWLFGRKQDFFNTHSISPSKAFIRISG